MNAITRSIIRIDKLATGGTEDGFTVGTHSKDILSHCKPAEYVPELLENGTRKDWKPINVVQPEGPSFSVQEESLVEWQGWRFRVGFNQREGATIHDVWYGGRSVLYRLSISEMVRHLLLRGEVTTANFTFSIDCPICRCPSTFLPQTSL